MNKVFLAENLAVLRELPSASVDLIYVDPPYNTKKVQKRQSTGLKYEDKFDDYIGFLRPRMEEAFRILKPTGTLYLHLDYREVHYAKVMMDEIFGRENFINEVIWSYDYGGRSKTRWSAKHDNILMYAKDNEKYTFRYEDIDRVPYMAPGLVGPEKAARGKPVTSSWWHTIVHTNGKEKTGYPTQKPLGIIRRIVKVSSNPGDTVLDFFAGSGTIGAACQELGRNFILIDSNPEAFEVMKSRLGVQGVEYLSYLEHKVDELNL